MKGTAKLIDITLPIAVGSCVIRHFKSASFVEVWSKTSKKTKTDQIGEIQKLVVYTEDNTYNVEGFNWSNYINLGLVEKEKEYNIKTIGDNEYALFFGEEAPNRKLYSSAELETLKDALIHKFARNQAAIEYIFEKWKLNNNE